jgi:hypothetical protein
MKSNIQFRKNFMGIPNTEDFGRKLGGNLEPEYMKVSHTRKIKILSEIP